MNPQFAQIKNEVILDHIKDFFSLEDRIPSYSELSDHFNISSSTAWRRLKALVKEGHLEERESEFTQKVWYRFPRKELTECQKKAQ